MSPRAPSELGKSNAAAGKGWETALAHALAELQQARLIGWVHRPEPAWRQVGGGRYVRTARALTDFLGVIRGSGRAFAIEAKSTDQGRLYRQEVKPHQAQILDETVDAGGVALLAVEFRGAGGGRFLVPWCGVPWERLKTAESLAVGPRLADWAVPDLRSKLEFMLAVGHAIRAVATEQQIKS